MTVRRNPIPRTEVSRGTRRLERIARLGVCQEGLRGVACWILEEFERFYGVFQTISPRAQEAFEARDPATSLSLSRHRLSLYSEFIHQMGSMLRDALPAVVDDEDIWGGVEAHYLPLIAERYEWDLALAFLQSVRRKVYQGERKPVEYKVNRPEGARSRYVGGVCRRFRGGASLGPETVMEILQIPQFRVPYLDIEKDAALVAERANLTLELNEGGGAIEYVDMVDAGFFRNRGAYLVGRITLRRRKSVPFIIALLNSAQGIYVDAVLHSSTDAHNCFSSTLANFHVTHSAYHEVSAFLYDIMPGRTLGLHYTTIGYNHLGKVAVMHELESELTSAGEVLETSVGFRGTVAIGFSAPSSAYNLKVIRDRPTDGYKWGEFAGIAAVLEKYSRVHEINRTGSMLDNIIYYNLKLDRAWFAPELLDELLEQARASVSLQGSAVVFKYLIVQMRLTPLPVYLETAPPKFAEIAVTNLGYCIKNNAAANIFNKDLDARNYGVSQTRKVYLFDYDALEPFDQVKIRSNQDRIDGEEDIPDWYFEDGVVFLPEEIEVGLCISDRGLRRLFRTTHGELLTTEYWETVQRQIQQGKVPQVSVYPDARKLHRA